MSTATDLAQQQRDLLHAIFDINNIATQSLNTATVGIKSTLNSYSPRGLKTYRANATASARRSLQTAYPVIAQLIGGETFEYLARDFWAQHPPTRGDLAQWGVDLSYFVASIPALHSEPYLGDVAKAEWALHTAATATDHTADLTTFTLLTQQDPDALTLQLAPGTTLVRSLYPIASILTAHLYGSPSFEEVGGKLRQNLPEIALVWRQGLQPMIAPCSTTEAVFIEQLLNGSSLLAALEAATSHDATVFDINAWLPAAIQSGLLLGVRYIQSVRP